MQEVELNAKNKLVQTLLKTPHGNLSSYVDLLPIAKLDKDLFAHYIAWNIKTSKITDSKCALPILALRTFEKNNCVYAENALAALMLLNPRELEKAYNFSKELSALNHIITGGWRDKLQKAIQKYIQIREANIKWWDSCVMRNRKAMTTLYTISHSRYNVNDRAQKILFKKEYPYNSVFRIIKDLNKMPPLEACGQIIKHKIPMSVVMGSGIKIKDNRDVLLALVETMTGNELINSTKMLANLGAFNFREIKASYDKAIEKAKTDTKVNVFKASKAIEKVDKKIGNKLLSIQESKEKELPNINANVLILGDASGSMSESIEITKKIASVISNKVNGNKYLVFFNSNPRFFDITNCTSSQDINKLTESIKATGNTSIGCGLEYLNKTVDMIIIVSDGGDNYVPLFHTAYKRYKSRFLNEPLVYFFRVNGDPDSLSENCERNDIDIVKFDVEKSFDYYSLPNILSTIKESRYTLLNEILDTPLLSFEKVFSQKGE